MNRKAYTVKDARSQMGGVSQAFFYKIMKGGEIKTFKMGGRRLVSAGAIDEYIKQQEQKEQGALQ